MSLSNVTVATVDVTAAANVTETAAMSLSCRRCHCSHHHVTVTTSRVTVTAARVTVGAARVTEAAARVTVDIAYHTPPPLHHSTGSTIPPLLPFPLDFPA
ncbi:unnamed protein product [Cuscuta epithymum]|uniref:Uncharacterized protein n=1 Tax=Cuscuta epithymum TaxID=186058 RepID=A0AAV0ET91_9ASTE|nr:unnamed protein product [Cuscuta epithymum]